MTCFMNILNPVHVLIKYIILLKCYLIRITSSNIFYCLAIFRIACILNYHFFYFCILRSRLLSLNFYEPTAEILRRKTKIYVRDRMVDCVDLCHGPAPDFFFVCVVMTNMCFDRKLNYFRKITDGKKRAVGIILIFFYVILSATRWEFATSFWQQVKRIVSHSVLSFIIHPRRGLTCSKRKGSFLKFENVFSSVWLGKLIIPSLQLHSSETKSRD